MKHLFESYTDYLSSNPGEFNSIILWTITMFFVYFIMIKYRKTMLTGASGQNGFMESNEQVIYMMNWVWPPVVSYSAFFNSELPVWCWWFMAGCIAWALGGRWLFEWALALRAGATKVDESTTEVKTKVEVQSTTTA
jgi:hypothetical protein